MINIGEITRDARRRQRSTKKELAELCGCQPATIRAIEQGNRRLIQILEMIMDHFGLYVVPVDRFMICGDPAVTIDAQSQVVALDHQMTPKQARSLGKRLIRSADIAELTG